MKENLKKFLVAASADEELKREIDAINECDGDEIKKAAVELAHKHGFDLELADFEQEATELDDGELDEVAGGGVCYCFVGGGGTPDSVYNYSCGCVGGGAGGSGRCVCVGSGYGSGCSDD